MKLFELFILQVIEHIQKLCFYFLICVSVDNLKHTFREQIVVHPPFAKTFKNVLFDKKKYG